ncbi:YrhK family protein [uncultured Gilvimarinus sp.]|uniref:YrhK family protein n=1 Tax=uncultured Gilvimarinus sp. TaxID=1689143 RepID=UPI0030EF8BA0
MFELSLFDRGLPHLSARHIKISSRYDFFYALNDLVAGILFVVGSVLFFKSSTEYAATWLFLIGSILFTARPAIRVIRNIHLQRVSKEGH